MSRRQPTRPLLVLTAAAVSGAVRAVLGWLLNRFG